MVQTMMVKVSDKQLSKLRNGHKVRVKPDIEGKGILLIVNPQNYSLMTRSFKKMKGSEIALSPEEIQANKEAAPQMEGKGIFGKKFDRFVEKKIGKANKKILYRIAEQGKPIAQTALAGLIGAASAAAIGAAPELSPYILPAAATATTLSTDYIANPSKYQSKEGKRIAAKAGKDTALTVANKELGTNMTELNAAEIRKAATAKAVAEAKRQAKDYMKDKPTAEDESDATASTLGSGLYAGRNIRMTRGAGLVGRNGGFISQLPPAMQSQPYSANFQFRNTLPPAYQKFSKGAGLYA